jgi:DNA-binding PadR family transcriptional regulator
MSAKHALLGLLRHRPAYPGELGARLQETLGPSWEINSGQLSQTIRRLEEDGLIQRVDDAPDDRSDKRIFGITERGIDEVDRWFSASKRGVRLLRRPLLVKFALAGPDRLKDALDQLDDYERDCVARLKELTRERDHAPLEGSRVRAEQVLLSLGLSGDISHVESELGWARHAREMISWLLHQDAIWPSTRGRAGAPTDDARARRSARKELFGRMATRQPRKPCGPEDDRGA